MIREVETRNFRNLRDGVFRITSPMLVAGPNNSGKTSLLRAISLWAELMTRWIEGVGDPVREDDGNYPLRQTQLANITSIPLANGDHLWTEKKIEEPIRIALRTDEWRIALEIVHLYSEFLGFRPAADVEDRALDALRARPLRAVYLSPVSGLDVREPPLRAEAVPAYLALNQAGSILRTIVREVSEDERKWRLLTAEMQERFGWELQQPSVNLVSVQVGYREAGSAPTYELECAGSGALQVLLMHATLLRFEGAVVLLDEPDAHLHPWLWEETLRSLSEFARRNGSQMIAATHSVNLIRAAEARHLSVMVDGRQALAAEGGNTEIAQRAVETLDPEDIALAPAASGILYVEGPTDLPILRAWAERLGHPAHRFLARPFWKPYAMGRKPSAPQHHRLLRRLFGRKIPGVVLRDGDGKEHETEMPKRNGLRRLFWRRYEIESYLLHPRAVERFATEEEGSAGATAVKKRLWDGLPRQMLRSPLGQHDFLDENKGKPLLARALEAMERPPSPREYWRIAAVMTPEEIHPEVVEKLDAIAEWFGLTGDEAGPAVSGR